MIRSISVKRIILSKLIKTIGENYNFSVSDEIPQWQIWRPHSQQYNVTTFQIMSKKKKENENQQ